MPRAIDFNRLTITHDPTQRQDLALPTFPPITIEQLLENWQKVLKQFTGIDLSGLDGGLKLFVEFIGGLFNIDFSDLANLPSPEDAWAQIAAKIFSVTGVNIASWPAFLASLDDGAGIDLPAVPRLVSALEGIDLSQPGSVLAAILAAAGFGDLLEAIIGEYHGDDEVLLAIQDIFMPLRRMVQLVSGNDVDWPTLGELESGWSHLFGAIGGKIEGLLSGLIDISWLTDQHQNLILESGYDSAVTVVAEDDPAITQDATDGVPDTDPLGCLRIALDGQQHYRIGELIAVGKGWELQVASRVKRESVSASAGSIRVELQPYSRAGDVVTPVGGRVSVCSVAAPGGSSSGWPESISGSWSVPSDGSVTHISVIPGVTAGAASGVVKFDNTTMFATQNIPQAFVNELTEDLDSLLNWIQTVVDTLLSRLGLPAVGTLLDRIHDLGDEIQLMQENAGDALAGLADKLGITAFNNHLAELLSNPAALLGNIPQSLVSGLTGAVSEMNQVRDLLAGLIVTPINSTVQAIKDALSLQSGKMSKLTNAGKLDKGDVLGLQGAIDTVDAAATAAGNVAHDWIDGFWNGLKGFSDSLVPVADAQGAAASIADALAAHASAIAAMQVSIAGSDGGGGASFVDEFSRTTASGLGGDWTETRVYPSTGAYVYCNGSEVEMWDGSGGNLDGFKFQYNGVTLTDYQAVMLYGGTKSAESHLPIPGGKGQYTRIYARMNASGTHYVACEIGGDSKAQFVYAAGGSESYVGEIKSIPLVSAGGQYSLRAGSSALGIRLYQLYYNGSVYVSWQDTSSVSSVGANYRGWGWGTRWGNRGLGQTTPARVTAVTCADSVPVSITGTGGTVARASTGGSGSLTSLQTVPSGTWDTVVAISPSGISFNTSTGVWSIAKAGWYHVDCRAWLSANVGTKYYNLILQKNGSNIAAGPISVGSSDSYSPDAITGSWTEYFSAGDTMSMAAYKGGGSSQIVGGPGLDNTRWSVALVSG